MTAFRTARVIVTAAFVLALPSPAHAGSMPAWVNPRGPTPALPVPEDCPAEVLFDGTSLRFERGFVAQVTRRRVVHILHSGGLWAAVMAVDVEPGGVMEDFRAWTGTVEGARASSGPALRVESMLSDEGPTDVRRVALAAPEARAGDIVAFEATWRETKPFPLVVWWPQESDLPVRRAELEVSVPRGWSADVRAERTDVVDAAPEPERVRVTLLALPMVPDEVNRPAFTRLAPRVLVHLHEPSVADRFATWPDLSRWFDALCRPRVDGAGCPAELRSAAQRLDPAARVEVLARAVQQHVRYVAIEMGARRWQPDSASATWQRRYGDCKDKAALLVSALRDAGIEARMVLASTGREWDVDTSCADPLQFNHCIVAFRWPAGSPPSGATTTTADGDAWTFFDPTDDSVPLGAIPGALGGTWALLAGERGGLVQLPPATPSTIIDRVTARLGEDGELAGAIVTTAEGPASEEWRARFGNVSPGERRVRGADLLRARFGLARLESCAVETDSAVVLRFALRLEFRLPGAVRDAGGRRLLRPHFDDEGAHAPPDDSTRVLPILLGAVGRYEQDWRVELPAGFAGESHAPIEWHGAAADYAAAFESAPSQVRVRRRYELRAAEVPASEHAEVWALLRARWAGEHVSLALSRR